MAAAVATAAAAAASFPHKTSQQEAVRSLYTVPEDRDSGSSGNPVDPAAEHGQDICKVEQDAIHAECDEGEGDHQDTFERHFHPRICSVWSA